MSGVNSIMDMGMSGLFLARLALQTTSHNIANVNTPGFSRQEVVAGARRPIALMYGSLGQGTTVEQLRRLTDGFLVESQRDQTAKLAASQQDDAALSEIEAIFGSVTNDHLGTALNAFFNAWNDLATPPYDASLKQAVVGAAQTLVTDLHGTAASLQDAARQINASLALDVDALNGLLRQVADINSQIPLAEINGQPANDLRDKRDALLLQVSKLTKVSLLDRGDGTVDVILKGRTVVTRGEAQTFVVERTVEDGQERARLLTAVGRVPLELDVGEIQGLIDARDQRIGASLAKLDDLARTLVGRVNELHAQGRTAGASGIAFFTGDSAATIDVSPAIAADSRLVSSSRSGLDGDNDIARAIADLASQPLDGTGSGSLLDRYNAMIAGLATDRSGTQFLLENQQNAAEAIADRLASVRGVSLDEEGANLVRYQNAYEAAARVVTVAAGLMQTLLDMVAAA